MSRQCVKSLYRPFTDHSRDNSLASGRYRTDVDDLLNEAPGGTEGTSIDAFALRLIAVAYSRSSSEVALCQVLQRSLTSCHHHARRWLSVIIAPLIPYF